MFYYKTWLFSFRILDSYMVAEALFNWNFSYNLFDKVINPLINV